DDIAFTMANPGRSDPERNDYWWPQGLIEAHEAVHAGHFKNALESAYTTLVENIESITLRCPDYNQAEAEAEMQSDINNAIETFENEFSDVFELDYNHEPAQDFLAAHSAVLSPWRDKVDAEAAYKGCF